MPPTLPPPLNPLDVPPMDVAHADAIDRAVASGIRDGATTGAVVVVVSQGEVIFQKAYGHRQRRPTREPMTLDTLFDLSSVTKPIATALSVMKLVERGKVALDAPVARYLPGFEVNQKADITIEDLLRHQGGLEAANHLRDYQGTRDENLMRIRQVSSRKPADGKARYSDTGYIALGAVVEAVSGMRLDAFAQQEIFAPLGLVDAVFVPTAEQRAQTAATAKRADTWLRGEVHDPRAARLDGVAGHAGLFASGPALATVLRMLVHRGESNGKRILAASSVAALVSPSQDPSRTLGFHRIYGGLGHTGFSGTLIWMDPSTESAAVVLTNRLHVSDDASVSDLRKEVMTYVRSAIIKPPRVRPVRLGIDVLVQQQFAPIRGKRVAVLTHEAGRDSRGARTIDILAQSPDVDLVRIFSPEHGLSSDREGSIKDERDADTGLPIVSLYGDSRKLSAKDLEGIDVIVIDLQDVGVRFYTYATTMGYALEAAAKQHVRVVVLDRPNPLGGIAHSGPLLDRGFESFVAYHPVPITHGMTMGELAQLCNDERHLNVDLDVVRMRGWRREDLFEDTGLTWVAPSPNLRDAQAAMLYPGLGMLEMTPISVGRGTDAPFHQFGAPWMDSAAMVNALQKSALPGLTFRAVAFTPTSSVFAGQPVAGVAISVADPRAIQPIKLGLTIANLLLEMHPDQYKVDRSQGMFGNRNAVAGLRRGDAPSALEASFAEDNKRFAERRAAFLLY